MSSSALKSFRCPECSFTSTDFFSVDEHVIRHDVDISDLYEMVEGGYLDVVDGRPKHIMNLAAFKRTKEQLYKEVTATTSRVTASMSVEPGAYGKEITDFYVKATTLYTCDVCPVLGKENRGYTSREPDVLSRHLIEVHGIKFVHNCKFCCFGSNKKAIIRVHMDTCLKRWPDSNKHSREESSSSSSDEESTVKPKSRRLTDEKVQPHGRIGPGGTVKKKVTPPKAKRNTIVAARSAKRQDKITPITPLKSDALSPELISFYNPLRDASSCPVCPDKFFKELNELSKHLVAEHGYQYQMYCKFCGLGSNKRASLREHKMMCRERWPDAKKGAKRSKVKRETSDEEDDEDVVDDQFVEEFLNDPRSKVGISVATLKKVMSKLGCASEGPIKHPVVVVKRLPQSILDAHMSDE